MPEQTPVDFQQKLDDFNNGLEGGGVTIDVCFDPKIKRWTVWAIPQGDNSHPQYRPEALKQLLRTFPDGSGRRGVKLFTWAETDAIGNDAGPRQLDDRIFRVLHWADSFRDKQHFEQVFEAPETRRELATRQDARELAYYAKNYWHGLDRTTVGYGSRGDWRWRTR